MNKVIMMGRLTRDPEVRYGGASNIAIARMSIAVDRRFKREGQPEADFFEISAFGKLGEFAEKYLRKGTKIVLDGEVQNNNYTGKDGQKVYGTRIVANSIEFAESKSAASSNGNTQAAPTQAPAAQPADEFDDGFMSIDDSIDDEGIPFAN